MPNSYTIPFVSVLIGDPENRYPVAIYLDRTRRCDCDDNSCSHKPYLLGDRDDCSPVFCAKHFRDINGSIGQSRIEPMTDEEMAVCIKHSPRTSQAKLNQAIELLFQVNDNWSEDDVEHYGFRLSFDELVAELRTIRLRS